MLRPPLRADISTVFRADLAYDSDGIPNPWYYEMQELGFNSRLTDIQAALGSSQLKKLQSSLERRHELADNYRHLLAKTFTDGEVVPLEVRPDVDHAYHLFVVQIDFERLGVSRAAVMNRLRKQGIGTQVHYIPLHLQPYYRRHCGTGPGDFPQAEKYYARALSLPMYPELAPSDIMRVIRELQDALVGRKQTVDQHYIARR